MHYLFQLSRVKGCKKQSLNHLSTTVGEKRAGDTAHGILPYVITVLMKTQQMPENKCRRA